MPPDELRCIRCGFDLPSRVIHEINDSSGAKRASTGNPLSAQLNWGTIWAEQAKKREARVWRIFLVIYLAGLVYLAIKTLAAGLPDFVLAAAIAFAGILLALPIAFLGAFIWSIWMTVVTCRISKSGSLWEAVVRSTRQVSWTRVFAAVLTSNVFFLASCTGGFIASYISSQEVGGKYMDKGEKPSDSMVVIGAVPDAAKQGALELKQVTLRDIEQFKTANPVHSFLLPLGSGQIQIHSEASVTYTVQPTGDGKVLVETKHHQSMGGLVVGRYEATEKSIQPKFTNNVDWIVALFLGIMIAISLYLFGLLLRYWAAKERHA